MLHWLYDPKRKIRRFVEENMKAKPEPITDPQVLHIMDMAARHGMRPSDVNSLAEELEPERLVMPQNNHERFDQLLYMMQLLLDDLNLDSAEKDFLKEFTVEIGLPVEKVPIIVRDIYNGLKNEWSIDVIKQKVIEILEN